MRERVLAKRYAQALLDLGQEEKALERLEEEVGRLQKAFALEPALLKFLAMREWAAEKKEESLKRLSQTLLLSPWIDRFLKLLLKRSRINLFPTIAAVFAELILESENKVVAKVKVADRKSIANLEGLLQNSLEKTTGKKIKLEIEEQPSLIGGLQVCIGDTIYDVSLTGELARIKEQWLH